MALAKLADTGTAEVGMGRTVLGTAGAGRGTVGAGRGTAGAGRGRRAAVGAGKGRKDTDNTVAVLEPLTLKLQAL